jgi:hypothetical protein
LARTERAATCALSYVETRAALARSGREGRLVLSALRRARSDLDAVWSDIFVIDVVRELLAVAADLTDLHPLRAGDAIQLAAASVVEGSRGPVVFACFDDRLRTAAAAAGFTVWPAAS